MNFLTISIFALFSHFLQYGQIQYKFNRQEECNKNMSTKTVNCNTRQVGANFFMPRTYHEATIVVNGINQTYYIIDDKVDKSQGYTIVTCKGKRLNHHMTFILTVHLSPDNPRVIISDEFGFTTNTYYIN